MSVLWESLRKTVYSELVVHSFTVFKHSGSVNLIQSEPNEKTASVGEQYKLWVWCPSMYNCGILMYVYDSFLKFGDEGKKSISSRHLQLQSEFEANLGCMRACLKANNKNVLKSKRHTGTTQTNPAGKIVGVSEFILGATLLSSKCLVLWSTLVIWPMTSATKWNWFYMSFYMSFLSLLRVNIS